MKKKVAIVTVYNACNYGSFLQAYALKLFLEQWGYSVDYIELCVDFDKITGKNRLDHERAEYELLKYQQLKRDQQIFHTIANTDRSYICCVLGSDTIWNMFDGTYSEIPYFVGKNINCSRIISYAASVGQSRLLKIILLKGRKLLPIRKIDLISVRDDKTEKIVHLLGRRCDRVLDPTFLYDFTEIKPNINIPSKFILVYTYGFSERQIHAIKTWAQTHRLEIVATGSLCSWSDYNCAVNSLEWLWLVKYAEVIITSTFHGTVFSIKYNKNFAVLTDSSDKVRSLLKEFALENRICTEQTMKSILDKKIDYEKVNEIKKKKIQFSREWLLNNIEGK